MNIEDTKLNGRFEFRYIRPEEAEEAAAIEAVCFPPNEACSKQHMIERVRAVPDFFLVAIALKTGRMAGFLNGIATNESVFRDEFFTDSTLHNPEGEVERHQPLSRPPRTGDLSAQPPPLRPLHGTRPVRVRNEALNGSRQEINPTSFYMRASIRAYARGLRCREHC